MPPRRMRGPTLAQLMQARQEGGYASSAPAEMTPEELALFKAEEEMRASRGPQVDPSAAQQAARLELGQMPTDADRAALWGRRGADVGTTVSPDVFAQRRAPPEPGMYEVDGVWTNDPRNVRVQRPLNIPVVRDQLRALAAQSGAGEPVFSEDGSVMRGPDGYPVNLSDQDQVAEVSRQYMERIQPRSTVPDVIEGLMIKAREANASASDYMPLPKSVAEQYGVDGVNLGALSIAEKMTLRRMGVKLPTRRQ